MRAYWRPVDKQLIANQAKKKEYVDAITPLCVDVIVISGSPLRESSHYTAGTLSRIRKKD